MKEQPYWYKDAIIYEVRVGAFHDANSDGVGDFQGLADKLDYIQELGTTAIWLLPFYPSPGKDDGYDISAFTEIHSSLGTIKDFKFFLKEAHKRGIRVITELVVNHTSDQHPWFQRARRSPPNSKFRDFYVWSDTPEKYKDARVIFRDFEPSNWRWDPMAKAYYWHRFYSHQPDLNFDNPDVQKAVFQVMDFWFEMGVDGMRLDAIPYIFEREGTNCENLKETHDFLKKLRQRMDRKYKDKMFLAEANQWPEDAVPYFGNGDECHMAFHFPIMPRLFMALHMEDRYPIIDILEQTPAIPENCQWAIFLRNHDELTLEMVTDEERDYMYRVYATDPQARINFGIRRRLAPLLGNHRRKIELMNGLLFSLPGTPVLYYGDEIGMGDNIYLGDRNGVRTPMQWSGDRNAGFSKTNPQKLYLPINLDPEYHYETNNVEAQQSNPHSLLWWMKRLMALRKQYKAFGRGSIEFLNPANPKVLTFIRKYEEETILVVANLSRYVQFVELNLAEYKEMVPVEIFGQIEFPPIGELPYFVTLGPHSFYWFSLKKVKTGEPAPLAEQKGGLPTLEVKGTWESLLTTRDKARLEEILPVYLQGRRWYGGKALKIKALKIEDVIPIQSNKNQAYLTMLRIDYADGNPEIYTLPLTFASGDRQAEVLVTSTSTIVSRVKIQSKKNGDSEGILYDAMIEPWFCGVLLDLIQKRRLIKTKDGILVSNTTSAFRKLRGSLSDALDPTPIKGEQSNSSVIFGDRLILKMFRRLEKGLNPDLEICRFLTEQTSFTNIPLMGGFVEYRKEGQKIPITVATLQGFVPNQGDAWRYTVDDISRYYGRTASKELQEADLQTMGKNILELINDEIPPLATETIGSYLESARLLGQRTAELHMGLASNEDDPDFSPEPFSPFTQRALYQTVRNISVKGYKTIRKSLNNIKGEARKDIQDILDRENQVLSYFEAIRQGKISAVQTRVHGDYHLGQVLYTGKDFIIIDFEGEPARSLSERKLKRSPLKDVAGMLRSFHYAAHGALFEEAARGSISPERLPEQEKFALFWYQWVSVAFLKSYLETAKDSSFIPKEIPKLELLLNVFLFEKAIYELNYELNNRPDWVKIPIRGMLHLLDTFKRGD
jgi:maltose alpha-D-glucosyltransferase/alpha-amylase